MKLNKSHKDKIIGGIITIIILFFTLYIKECFEKRSPKSDPQQTNNFTSIKAEDSSSQNIIQSQQNNTGSGNMSVENIGTKNVTNIGQIQKTPSNIHSIRPEVKIEGNNGNINTGSVQGNLTQTIITKPPARHLTQSEAKQILSSIPQGYRVHISFPFPDKEPVDYADEIYRLLLNAGYRPTASKYGQIVPDLEQNFSVEPQGDSIIITVYRQK